MKKLFSYLMLMLLSVPLLRAADESIITMSTSLPIDSDLRLLAWCQTYDETISIDWGDGNYVDYHIDPDAMTFSKWISGKLKGSKLTIKGNLVYFDLTQAGLTSFESVNESKLAEINLSKNELMQFSTEGLTALRVLDLSENKLTSFDTSSCPAIEELDLSKNEIDSHEMYITNLAPVLRRLMISENKLVTLNLIDFSKLEYFDAHSNPDLTTVVFNDGSTNLESINMNDCYIMHFYGISLPNLMTLHLSNGALLELEEGNYPKLAYFSIDGNYLTEINLTQFPELYTFDCSNNKLSTLDVSNNLKLNSLQCGENELTSLDLSNNKNVTYLSVKGNSKLAKLDISMLKGIQTLNINDTKISYIDLSSAYFLREFNAQNTECSFFYFNYVDAFGRFAKADLRNNKNMTSSTVNFMLRTLPTHYGSSSGTSLWLEGSNAEHADTSYATSLEMGWNTDITGDGTATNEDTAVTIDATPGNKIKVTGQFGGMTADQTFEFTEYQTDNGKFTVSQWSGPYYQQLSDVTNKAKIGVAIHITPMPDEGYTYKGVMINDELVTDEWFVISEPSTIKVLYRQADSNISFTTGVGQELSIALASVANDTPISIDWGNGSKQEFRIGTKYTRFDGVAAGERVIIYGDINGVNFESFGEYGEIMGIWNNKITSVDLSNNDMLVELNVYMNPIGTLDVSNQKNLISLDCGYCELTDLNLSGLNNLLSVNCRGNELEKLDLSSNPNLIEFDARVNKLSAIDLSGNTKLQLLSLAGNNLSAIDVSMLTDLLVLDLQNNKLETINIENNKQLVEFSVGGNSLQTLNLNENKLLERLSFNDNAITELNLSDLVNLRKLNVGGNGMSACQLNDFYYNLPQHPELTEDEIGGVSLTVLTGTEETPNDVNNADSGIAAEKQWIVNMTGNASGCDVAYLEILPTVNGSIELKGSDGTIIKSGDKVKKNSPITLTALPDNGYELSEVMLNNTLLEESEFSINRFTKVKALFKIFDGVRNAILDGITIKSGCGQIMVNAETECNVFVYDTTGKLHYSTTTDNNIIVNLIAGVYIVRIENAQGVMAKIVQVK